MTTLWIFTGLFLLLACLILWHHFFKSSLYSADQSNMRGQTNKDLYHEHLKELEKDFSEGGVDKENFEFLKEELDQSLLLDMSATAKEEQAKDKRTSILWPVMLTLFIVAFSAAYYYQHGAYADVELAASQPANHPQGEQSEAQVVIAQMQNLHKEVQDNPQNADAWFQLGQLLTSVAEFDSAFIAYGKVLEIEGEQADVLALQAQAKYYKNKQQRNAEINALLDRALMLDPNDPTTLMLIGMDHYFNEQYLQAASVWQQIIDTGGAGANQGPLLDGIAQARKLASEGGSAGNNADKSARQVNQNSDVANPQPTENTVATTAATASIQVTVDLSEQIIAALNQGGDKTLFIYAIASNGSRMPLAAVKAKASDLPMTVTLDDSKAMSPRMTISTVDMVNVLAVISHAGTPGAKAGDYKGEVANVKVNANEVLNLTIDTIVE
ncbi:c-type cytochrome biogenesis protein CcmI [Thalassotalea sp. 42_200_T64]|nr:c-type cytochrome biogenesis protein CcmI [Thalassotalea sp. 42_200_T64]